MSSFVSIIKLASGAAAYRVVEGTGPSFTAYLLRNASSESLPGEVTINPHKSEPDGSPADPVVERLLTVIRSRSFINGDPI